MMKLDDGTHSVVSTTKPGLAGLINNHNNQMLIKYPMNVLDVDDIGANHHLEDDGSHNMYGVDRSANFIDDKSAYRL